MKQPQSQTAYEPSADDPRILGALDAKERLGVAMRHLDFSAIETLMAPDLVVHAPINMIVNRDSVLALRSGQISYEPDVERKIAFAGVRGDVVVIMGEEIVTPTQGAPNAGKRVHRRFTEIWKLLARDWSLVVRQATVISAE